MRQIRMEFIAWDPTLERQRMQPWSVASIPIKLAWLNDVDTDSSWEIVRLVDRVMSMAIGDLVTCLIMDGEGCNTLILRILHNDIDANLQRKVQSLQWFSRLRFQPLRLEWPRVPMQLCTIDQEPLFGIVGPAHSMKNAAGQLQSHIRTLYYGDHFADLSGALPGGIPWPAYQRRDPMSDRLCSLLCSPQFLVAPIVTWINNEENIETNRDNMKQHETTKICLDMIWWLQDGELCLANIVVPWHLKGCLLWNLSSALCLEPGLKVLGGNAFFYFFKLCHQKTLRNPNIYKIL